MFLDANERFFNDTLELVAVIAVREAVGVAFGVRVADCRCVG